MLDFRRSYSALFLRCALRGAIVFTVGASNASSTFVDNSAELLRRADDIRMSNHVEFLSLMQRLNARATELTATQKIQLLYLKGWNAGYEGDYKTANPLLEEVISQADDVNLKYSARLSIVNNLVDGLHYEEAFRRLSELLNQLPQITDSQARAKGLGMAALVYEEAGQYDLAVTMADRLLNETAPGAHYKCVAGYVKVAALYQSGQLDGIDKQLDQSVDGCLKAADKLYANGIRFFVGSLELKRHQPDHAIALIEKNLPDVERIGYPGLISRFDALVAQAYWEKGDTALANRFALVAVAAIPKNEFGESITTAYRVLYLVAHKTGDMPAALAYHEKYMAADKGYLDEVSAKALAFQVVNQQLLGKKLQIDTLNKQNQILELQRSLGAKASETSRLYIILLLTVLGSIALWAWRLKRSQLSYMKLARRDGLTGIFNRQHFVASAERSLRYCQKSGRVAGLIVIDLDNFKNVNDVHGHAVGDYILKRAVAACEAHLRSTDVFGRLGGEEFGILMPECDSSVVAGRAELIRMAIASVSNTDEATGVEVSASFGVSSSAHSGYNLRQLLIHADKALYGAKHNGRNRVVVFSDLDALSSKPAAVLPLIRR